MNTVELDLLNILSNEPFVNQRLLANASGHSLGMVNRSIRNLVCEGYLTNDIVLTPKAREEMRARAPHSAIILAAGIGMRMAPVNLMQPKGMIEVHGEPLVERLVCQLREAGVASITIVVGFMKERFEYLIDEYGVELVVNPEFSTRNNLHSLALVADRLSNTYIVPSDIWCARNPFHRNEPYSWYMVSDLVDDESFVRISRKGELLGVRGGSGGNRMVGIAYLLEEDSATLRDALARMDSSRAHASEFWESAVFAEGGPRLMARSVHTTEVFEIDTYEQLRELDEGSGRLNCEAIDTIAAALHASADGVKEVRVLKKGAINRTFLFSVGGSKYVARIPGVATEGLVNRDHEAKTYKAIAGRGLCDKPVLVDPESGCKIAKYVEGARHCNASSEADLRRCMALLKAFHAMDIKVDHTFDLYERIDFFESLWGGSQSAYRDYEKTKANVLSLRLFVESVPRLWCLTHIDPVADNFLFYPDGTGGEALQLIDWEYAGMQDPHVDIAMFAIYNNFDKGQLDHLVDVYFADEGGCDAATRAKVYCYVATCGLLWSNWCEHNRNLGVEFGAYSLAQYRYAKEFYRYAKDLISTLETRSKSACSG